MAAWTEMQIRKKMENKGLGRDVAKNYQDRCYLLNLFVLEGADAWLVCYISIVKTPYILNILFLKWHKNYYCMAKNSHGQFMTTEKNPNVYDRMTKACDSSSSFFLVKVNLCFCSCGCSCVLLVDIKPDTPINVYTRFCLNTAKSKFSLVSPVADWWKTINKQLNWIVY